MKKKERDITDDEFEIIMNEIIDYFIEENLKLALFLYNDNFKEAIKIRDELIIFIKDTTAILQVSTKIRYQRIFLKLHLQNDMCREMLIERINNNNGKI